MQLDFASFCQAFRSHPASSVDPTQSEAFKNFFPNLEAVDPNLKVTHFIRIVVMSLFS